MRKTLAAAVARAMVPDKLGYVALTVRRPPGKARSSIPRQGLVPEQPGNL